MKAAARAAEVADRGNTGAGNAATARLPGRPTGVGFADAGASGLTIGRADDPAEREADTMAEQALTGVPLLRPGRAPPTVRRVCAQCEDEESKKVRRKANGGGDAFGGRPAPSSVSSLLARPGKSLDPATRSYFEARFNCGFDDVAVHDGPAADQAAKAIGARAFTAGQHIAFASGQYAPHSDAGKRLIAHELAHVVQGGAPVLRRKPGDDDPLIGVTLALVLANPPTFRATFAFTKQSFTFDVKLVGSVKQIGLRPGKERISASPIYKRGDSDVPAGGVLFSLPDQSDAYLWFHAGEENWRALVRANEYLQNHEPVTLTITDARTVPTDWGDGKESGEQDKTPAPKFTPAEDWLTKQMLPAVKKVLADEHPSVKLGNLIPYQSVAIQASEGPDISMIQVNKPESKAIAGHVRVDRRKWVGKEADARNRYARDIAIAIVARLTESARKERLKDLDASLAKKSSGETFPAWVIKLKQSVDKKLAEAKSAALPGKPPQDIPDRLHLTRVGGELIYFQLFLERPAENDPAKMIWQVAVMTPSLDERHAEDVDALVRTVREQTALMRSWKVKSVEKSDEPERTNVLMQPIPADVRAKNMNADGTTVTGATNIFEMSVRIDLVFSHVGGRDTWNMIGISEGLGLRFIDVMWKVAPFTEYNAEDLVRPAKPAKGMPPPKPSDLYFDLANKDIDQQTKIGLATHKVDTGAIMRSNAYPVAATKEGVLDHLEYEFPKLPGVYLVVAETKPRPLVNEKVRQIFPPSRAILPVRVMTSQALAAETVAERPDAVAAKERAKANPALTERQRLQIDADIENLKRQEAMSQLGVVQAAEQNIDRQIARFTELRTWLIADRAKHPYVSGTPTDDPLLVRLSAHDQLHDTHHFETFQLLFAHYGDHAFDISYLAEPIESKLGQVHVLNQHLKMLMEQKKESGKLQGKIQEGEARMRPGGDTKQTVATLVIAESGNTVPLLLLVGEHPESKEDDYRYKIIDLTLSATPLYQMKNQIYVGEARPSRDDALHSAFVEFGEDNDYENGRLHYRFGGDSTMHSVPNVTTFSEYAQKAAMVLAVIGMIATVVATAGAATPAVAAVIAAITVANAVLATYLALQNFRRRSAAGTLELDADAALEVINVIASVVGVGSLAKGAQLSRIAQAARASGNVMRATSALGKLERFGRTMLIFDTAVLGATAVATAWKVGEDVSRVKDLHLPPNVEADLLKQVAMDAVMQGAMIAFQSVMLARSHLEMYRNGLENSRYQTMEERGWMDADGRVTDAAPPTLRARAEGKAPPVTEKPPVSLESDLPRIKAAAERGEAKRLTKDPEHDLEIPFRDENNELHTLKRRREDGVWCRYSSPYCYITKKDVERIGEQIGDLDGPHVDPGATPKPAPRGGKGVPGKSWGKIGYQASQLTDTIEATIKQAMADLKATLGKKWLLPHIYGTKLHKVVADLFRSMKLPRGWRAIVDQPLKKSGVLDPKFAKMTVREFLENHAPWLLPGKALGPHVDPAKVKYTVGVPDSLLNKKIGDIEPDLILVAPDGTKIVWDLAPTQNAEHMAKTIVYAHAIDSAGGRIQIGESYYRPQQHLELDGAAQGRFRGKAAEAEGARIKLNDDKARALARRNFGQGEPIATLPKDPELRAKVLASQKKLAKKGEPPPGPLPAGYSGSAELIKGDIVVGEYFDPKSKSWVETTNFSIHYSEGGVYIRPEAP